jgi:hypothetical protein
MLIICGEGGLLYGKGENLVLIGAVGCHRLGILFHNERRDPMDHSHGRGRYSSSEFTRQQGETNLPPRNPSKV